MFQKEVRCHFQVAPVNGDGDNTWLTIYLTLTVLFGIARWAGIIRDTLTEFGPIGRSLSAFPRQPQQNPIRFFAHLPQVMA